MQYVMELRSPDPSFLSSVEEALSATDFIGISIRTDGPNVEMGISETWYVLDTIIAFASGVGANVIANHISEAIRETIRRYSTKAQLSSIIEIHIRGAKIREDSLERLAKRLEDMLPSMDQPK